MIILLRKQSANTKQAPEKNMQKHKRVRKGGNNRAEKHSFISVSHLDIQCRQSLQSCSYYITLLFTATLCFLRHNGENVPPSRESSTGEPSKTLVKYLVTQSLKEPSSGDFSHSDAISGNESANLPPVSAVNIWVFDAAERAARPQSFCEAQSAVQVLWFRQCPSR